ncbi:MAG: nuclear transport factor 2 family protein [Betaproteobacteria bacterium]|nr:nuclear transport factor 2 family protein [Betaproteobacteria bacterium]
MENSLETRVRRLEALQAVNELIVDLGKAFDSGPSAEALRGLFVQDAVFKIDRYGTLEGCDAIAEGVAGNAETGFRWTIHYLVSPMIELDPNLTVAKVEFCLWEIATAASGKAYWIGGRYEGVAIAGPDRWRFADLELKADIISHYPQGWKPKPENLADA